MGRPEPVGERVDQAALERAADEVGLVVRGKSEVIRLALVSVLARGHLLLEDVPGVGKTSLARALARVLGGEFARIQLTADLLPVDIVGGRVIDPETQGLKFAAGPIFANVVLADELNRATPRTQSGLLEAMAEGAVSVDGVSHPLPSPFFVIATQNPSEHHGTYALPQSQMDRFLFRSGLGYPSSEVERGLLVGQPADHREAESLEPMFEAGALARMWGAVDGVHLAPEVADYLQAVVAQTRDASELEAGVSTRGLLQYAAAVRARALLEGRRFVSPEDVYALAVPVCAHRLVPRGGEPLTRPAAEALVAELRDRVPSPD